SSLAVKELKALAMRSASGTSRTNLSSLLIRLNSSLLAYRLWHFHLSALLFSLVLLSCAVMMLIKSQIRIDDGHSSFIALQQEVRLSLMERREISTHFSLQLHFGSSARDVAPPVVKKIHFMYKSFQVDAHFKSLLSSWRKVYPDYQMYFWTDVEIDLLISSRYPAWQDMYYRQLSNYMERSDAARAFAAARHGWLVRRPRHRACLSRADRQAAKHALILPLEPYLHALNHFHMRRLVSNAIMYSAPQHPFWMFYLHRLRQTLAGKKPRRSTLLAVVMTGPVPLTEAALMFQQAHQDEGCPGPWCPHLPPPVQFLPFYDNSTLELRARFRFLCTRSPLERLFDSVEFEDECRRFEQHGFANPPLDPAESHAYHVFAHLNERKNDSGVKADRSQSSIGFAELPNRLPKMFGDFGDSDFADLPPPPPEFADESPSSRLRSLRAAQLSEGAYIVRPGSGSPYCISFLHGGETKHVKIQRSSNAQFFLGEAKIEMLFDSMSQLMDYLTKNVIQGVNGVPSPGIGNSHLPYSQHHQSPPARVPTAPEVSNGGGRPPMPRRNSSFASSFGGGGGGTEFTSATLPGQPEQLGDSFSAGTGQSPEKQPEAPRLRPLVQQRYYGDEGQFLVRPSKASAYCLSVFHRGRVVHLKIVCVSNRFVLEQLLNDGQTYANVPDLIDSLALSQRTLTLMNGDSITKNLPPWSSNFQSTSVTGVASTVCRMARMRPSLLYFADMAGSNSLENWTMHCSGNSFSGVKTSPSSRFFCPEQVLHLYFPEPWHRPHALWPLPPQDQHGTSPSGPATKPPPLQPEQGKCACPLQSRQRTWPLPLQYQHLRTEAVCGTSALRFSSFHCCFGSISMSQGMGAAPAAGGSSLSPFFFKLLIDIPSAALERQQACELTNFSSAARTSGSSILPTSLGKSIGVALASLVTEAAGGGRKRAGTFSARYLWSLPLAAFLFIFFCSSELDDASEVSDEEYPLCCFAVAGRKVTSLPRPDNSDGSSGPSGSSAATPAAPATPATPAAGSAAPEAVEAVELPSIRNLWWKRRRRPSQLPRLVVLGLLALPLPPPSVAGRRERVTSRRPRVSHSLVAELLLPLGPALNVGNQQVLGALQTAISGEHLRQGAGGCAGCLICVQPLYQGIGAEMPGQMKSRQPGWGTQAVDFLFFCFRATVELSIRMATTDVSTAATTTASTSQPTTDDPSAITFDDATWILASTFVIFTMQSGFGLLESGCVNPRNEVNIMVKNVIDVLFGGLTYWMFGYAFSFGNAPGSNPFIGWGDFFLDATPDEMGQKFTTFIFQMSFATTATTIVSGAMAERTKLSAYILFSLLNTIIYCIPAHWIWGKKGFLNDLGVVDIAGVGPVHVLGGVTGLVATVMLKPRTGRFGESGGDYSHPAPQMGCPTNVMLGLFMLWWGWLGFNCGSTFGIRGSKWKLAARSRRHDHHGIGWGRPVQPGPHVRPRRLLSILPTLFAICRGKYDIADIVNGVLGGLVSIT
uniref:SH2 domain-containing protein n=1 Tax=Macrostomum lignano TaxID=282301 RepID=A0A1I8HGX5_9PLAT